MKAAVRDALASVLYLTGITPPKDPRRLAIVTFHRVLAPHELAEYPLPQIAVTPEELQWFLEVFSRHYECGPLQDMHQRWVKGAGSTRPLLAVTFDDAQRDNFRHAKPVLDRMGMRATFFVPTEAVETGRLLWHDRAAYATRAWMLHDEVQASMSVMSLGVPKQTPPSLLPAAAVERLKLQPAPTREHWIDTAEKGLGRSAIPAWDGMMSFEEVAILARDGHEIGSHSHTHALMTNSDDDSLRTELDASARILEQRLGTAPTSFCYPNGDADDRVVQATRQGRYLRAVTTAWGDNTWGTDPFRLSRFDMQSATARSRRGELSEARIAFRMSGFQRQVRS